MNNYTLKYEIPEKLVCEESLTVMVWQRKSAGNRNLPPTQRRRATTRKLPPKFKVSLATLREDLRAERHQEGTQRKQNPSRQGGRTFVGSKNGNENFRQACIYNFRVKSVVLARNRKFAKLTQWNTQYIPCNSALLAQETLFLTQKGTFFAQRSKKCINRDKS